VCVVRVVGVTGYERIRLRRTNSVTLHDQQMSGMHATPCHGDSLTRLDRRPRADKGDGPKRLASQHERGDGLVARNLGGCSWAHGYVELA